MRLPGAAIAFAVLCAACTPGGGRNDASRLAKELGRIARTADRSTYRATYRYTLVPAPSPGVGASFLLAQSPPNRLVRLEASFTDEKGNIRTSERWSIKRGRESFTCFSLGAEVTCMPWVEPDAGFGIAQLDEVNELVRDARKLTAVSERGADTIARTKGRCFETVPRPGTPPPISSPQAPFTPTRFRFELCYSPEGVLLRARRTIAEPIPPGAGGKEGLLEATSVSRTVRKSEFELPGPLQSPGARPASPTPIRNAG